jgi:hypothetical protein
MSVSTQALKQLTSSSVIARRLAGPILEAAGGNKVGKLNIFFGGTGRSAKESFNLKPPVNLIRTSPLVKADVKLFKPRHVDVDVMIDGPGYVDRDERSLHGQGTEWSFAAQFAAKMLNLGKGNMGENADALITTIHGMGEIIDGNTQISLEGYSRGAVSGAMVMPKLRAMFRKNKLSAKIYDPVAGPYHQGVHSVHGTNTIVQYSLDNSLPGFWATPVVGAKVIVIAKGGHSTVTRGNYGRLGDLNDLDPGIYLEGEKNELIPVSSSYALEVLESLHKGGGAYPEVPNTASRYQEIKMAVLHAQFNPTK